MNGLKLQDRLNIAAGRAAARIGRPCNLYHPPDLRQPGTSALDDPTGQERFRLRINAIFLPLGGKTRRPVPATDPLWEVAIDAGYTQPGDILIRRYDGEVFYIAAQQPLLPVLCVHAPRRVTIKRPASASVAGVNLYGGTVTALDTVIAAHWPASILAAGSQGTGLASIPAELNPGMWQVLLPPSLRIGLFTTDTLTDDQGRSGVIASIETTEYGTRLTVQAAST